MHLLCIQCKKTWTHHEFLAIRNGIIIDRVDCCKNPTRFWVEEEE